MLAGDTGYDPVVTRLTAAGITNCANRPYYIKERGCTQLGSVACQRLAAGAELESTMRQSKCRVLPLHYPAIYDGG